MGSVADRCVFRYYILEIRTLCIYCIFVFCIARKRERERVREESSKLSSSTLSLILLYDIFGACRVRAFCATEVAKTSSLEVPPP